MNVFGQINSHNMCDLKICRICLNTAVKMYKLEKHSLCYYYENVIRQKLDIGDELPQWVCYECAMMLHKYHKFKEKCLRGQNVLKQISLRGNITYESVAVINRYSEKLISSVGIAVASKRVKTTFSKSNDPQKSKIIKKIIKINDKSDKNKPDQRVEIKTETNISGIAVEDNIDNHMSNKFNSIQNCNVDIPGNNIVTSNQNLHLNKNIQQGEIKQENIKEIIVQTATNQVKNEMSESSISTKNINSDNEKTSKHTDNVNSNLENTNYDSDMNFDIFEHANTISSDDESLAETVKKSKVKRNPTYNTQEPKIKKSKTETDKEELKNTKPKKHFLNPQFWKKISLNEEEALREFKRREFDNDYYLRAKYKCQSCFKGFSKKDMLVRHLKHRHDESCDQAECRFCHMRFRHKFELVKHMQEHLILHHCLQCNLQFPRFKAALAHQEHHNGVKRTCKHCGKEFNHLSTYYTHLRMAHRSSHVCVACGASFVSEQGLLQHTKVKHFENMKQLEEEIRKRREACNKDATNEQPAGGSGMEASAAPAQVPDAEEIYCAKCDIKFMSRRAYNLHFFKSDNHDDGEAYAAVNKDGIIAGPGSKMRLKIPTTCEHCDKDFPSRQAYKKHHLAEHSHIPLYIPDERDICEICGASIQKSTIPYHMKSHTGEREFSCPAPACGMRFTLKANMNRHYNIKHLGVVYPKYIRKTPGRRKKKTEKIFDNDFSPFVKTRTGSFL